MRKYHRTQWGLGLSCLLLIVYLSVQFIGCDEAPFAPKDDDPVVKDYPVYFCDPNGDPQLFIFHPLTRIIDSVDIPWIARYGVTVSADGERLYLAQRTSVVVLDTDSFALITELPFIPRSSVAVSPNNEYLAITGDDLNILRTSDYEVVFSDTNWTYHGRFSDDSKSFYCSARMSSGTRGFVYKVDFLDSLFPVHIQLLESGSVRYIIPSIDETKWFLYLGLYTSISAFEVYDVAQDSNIFREIIVPGYGQIAMTPDGNKVFYNNPGNGTSFPASLSFTIFDVEVNAIDTVVKGHGFFSGSNWAAAPNAMTVTPDSRWLVILGGSMGLRVLYLYDIENRELVFREAWGGSSHVFSRLSTQLWK